MAPQERFTRRAFVKSTLAAFAPAAADPSPPSQDHGRVTPPIAVPDIGVVCNDGVSTRLPQLVRDRATALQVMFTSCTTTCPIQAAIFARVQKLIPDQGARGIQLLSISVDPAHDTPAALAKWLKRFHARPGWIAAAPRPEDIERLRDFAGRGRTASDNHSTQVLIVNRDGLLVWRTSELPEAEEIAAVLRATRA